MSDFHRSLNRALEGHETPNGNVYWFDEAYAWTPPPDRSFVDAFAREKIVFGSIDFTKFEVGPIESSSLMTLPHPATPLAEREIPSEGTE